MPVMPEVLSTFGMGAMSAIVGYLLVATMEKRLSFLALVEIAPIWLLFGAMLGMFSATALGTLPFPERAEVWVGMYVIFVIAQLSAPKLVQKS